ncbi:MAG: RNA polymerase sigma factor [Patescibacteria group bacterium]|nr:RNA polymerase sigma factor [Patescibacteria group bacterium]
MKNKKSDEELAILSLKDKENFSQIVNRYASKIQRYIARVTGNWQESEDITQEVFFKAYVNIASFNPKLKFSSWLYRIAHNESVNYIKKNYRTRNVELKENINKDLSDDQKIFEKIDATPNSKLVQKTLMELPPRDREIINLVFFEEKSYIEVSDILKMPINSIGPTISRAKNKLKILIKNESKT